MSRDGRRRLRRVVAAGLVAVAAMAGVLAAGGAHASSSHHTLADNGVIDSRN